MTELNEVIKECNRLAEIANVEITCPIQINSRLTSTLGRLVYYANSYKPKCIEFSKELLTLGNHDDVYSVIAHEMAHYVALKRTGQRHGHDAYFKAICHELGTDNDKTKTRVSYEKQAVETRFKYTVFCDNCKTAVGHYRTFRGHITHLNECTCGKCGASALYYKQNY